MQPRDNMAGNQSRFSDRDYRRISDLIRLECGIAFPQAKRTMVETRLQRRAKALGLPSLAAYCAYMETPEGKGRESPYLIDAVTTHKTDFFREPQHFDYLNSIVLPDLARSCGAGFRRPLEMWSSACSTGEEPYTLAMVLAEFAASMAPRKYSFRLQATDVSAGVIETARCGVYTEAQAEPIPQMLRRKYLLRSRDRTNRQVRIVPELRNSVEFRRLNLMDAQYGFEVLFDVVFCRNVMIYFDRSTQKQILEKICASIRLGGYLVMGHSESLNGFVLPLRLVAPTLYRRVSDASSV